MEPNVSHGIEMRRLDRGFTIVELLIVIVIIGILATLTIIAFNGVKDSADNASMQSELSQANRVVLEYKAANSDTIPASATAAGITVGTNHDLYYRATPDGKGFCIAVNMKGDTTKAWSATSTNAAPKKGTCQGYILVPGNATFGTSDFWVMKYEAKNIGNMAMSQAAGLPWTSITQSAALSASQSACSGCHLISDNEWLTIAQNVLIVGSNWSSGVVGTGYIYSGHNDTNPNNSLAASTDDTDGYNGTGNSSTDTTMSNGIIGKAERRVLTLTNGEVIWDLSGNVNEWTQGTIAGSNQPGPSGETVYTWKQWNSGGLLMRGLAANSQPGYGNAAASGWTSIQGIGTIYSNYAESSARSFYRGGMWSHGMSAGIFELGMDISSSFSGPSVGFRVAR